MIFDTSHSNLGNLGSGIVPIIAGSGQIAAGVVPGILAGAASASAAAGGSGLILGLAPALAVPVIGAAIAGVTLAVTMFLNRNSTYFAQAKATTGIVNDAEVLMKQNLSAWNNSDKYKSEQNQALDNFTTIWNEVIQACSSPNYGGPGKACVADRSRGGRWDWFSYYYDPILNDPHVIADPIISAGGVENVVNDVGNSATSFIDSVFSGSTSNSGNVGSGGLGGLVIPAILIGLGVWAFSKVGD